MKKIVFKGEKEDDNEEANVAAPDQSQAAAIPASNAAPADPPASHDVRPGRIADQNNALNAEAGGNQANAISQQDNNQQGNDQQQNDRREQNQEQQHQIIVERAEGDGSK